jgi:F-type H+-transporting ATPase subunit gamma
MPSIKDLKKRIGSVKNTQQTTRAMKMVSAAKLRRAQEAIQSQRPYAKQIALLIQEMVSLTKSPISPLVNGNDIPEGARKILLVVVTSDRGLCGGFNSNVIKSCQRWVQSNQNSTTQIELAFVGRKGHEYFRPRNIKTAHYFAECGGKVTFLKAKGLADTLIKYYLDNEYSEIKFIYNEFKNAVSQKVVVEDFLPLNKPSLDSSSDATHPHYIIKPNAEEVLKSLLAKNFSIQAFRILLESQAGEHGARMSAMENATKNAGEMIKKLTLQYNKQRQAGITKELLEIIAGSESQKG